ncbi:MAG: hypothetical protein KAS32_23080 [Candidatus Peribacteraceae bacterium]|nr:hypothetical protein [Candidatus Peribacteraceae bacterium]
MKFAKYSDIENSYRDKYINHVVRNTVPPSMKWMVSEKIDGANFAFYCDGKIVKTASRNQFVGDEFFGCKEVVDRHHDRVIQIANDIITDTRCSHIIIYGELHGPGIQNKINYGPEKDFRLFDIKFCFEDRYVMLSQFNITRFGKTYGIKIAPVLARGLTLDEALQFPNDGISTIFECTEDNIMEGVVIKPDIAYYEHNGSQIMIKNKNAKFSEDKKKKQKKEVILTPEQQAILDVIDQYITNNRFDALMSKQPWGKNQFGDFLRAFNHDVMTEVMKDHPGLFGDIEKPERKVVSKIANGRASVLCRKFLELV